MGSRTTTDRMRMDPMITARMATDPMITDRMTTDHMVTGTHPYPVGQKDILGDIAQCQYHHRRVHR
jgi:hypothetical protein